MTLKQLFCRHRDEECGLCREHFGFSFWLYCCKRCQRLRVTRFE